LNSGPALVYWARKFNLMNPVKHLRLLFYDGCQELLTQRDADVFIISYPKSGRTWLRLMLGKYLTKLSGVQFPELLETYELTHAIPAIPRIGVVHDGSGTAGINWEAGRLKESKRRYRGSQVALLVRDPRDTVTSYYFHCCRRLKVYRGEFSSFLRDESYGLPKIIRFLNIWAMNRDIPRGFLLIRYEDMHLNPAGELARLLTFIGAKCDPVLVDKAAEFAGFEKMREMELQGKFMSDRLRPGDRDDPESYKTRRGMVGTYFDYLSSSDLEYASDLIQNELSPIFGYT
jgi:hypothetical protein